MSEFPPTPPHRKRLRRRETGSLPRFVTFSCYRQLPLLGTAALRRVFLDALREHHEAGEFHLIAWVVMPEHVHLIVLPTPDHEWGPVAAAIKTGVGKRILARWKRLRAPILAKLHDEQGDLRFWQHGGGFDRNVRDDKELTKEIRYIHHNPVVRELAAAPCDWTWSSVRFWRARHECFNGTKVWERSGDHPAAWQEWWTDDGHPTCDWPLGDWRSWAMWSGFE